MLGYVIVGQMYRGDIMQNVEIELGKVIGSLKETNKRLDNIETDIQDLKLSHVKIQSQEDSKIDETDYIKDIQEIKHKIDKIDSKVDTLHETGRKRDDKVEAIDKKYSNRLDVLERAKGEEAIQVSKTIRDKLIDKILSGTVSAILITVPLWMTGTIGK